MMPTDMRRGPRRGRGPRVILFALLMVGAAVVAGWVVMALWNAVLVKAVGVKPLSFWQGLGLLLLCRILFGRFGPPRRVPRAMPFGSPGMTRSESCLRPDHRARLRQYWESRHVTEDEGGKSDPPGGASTS